MRKETHIEQVGLPDPEHRTSPIADETGENLGFAAGEDYDEKPVCYFNGRHYADGDCVESDHQLLC